MSPLTNVALVESNQNDLVNVCILLVRLRLASNGFYCKIQTQSKAVLRKVGTTFIKNGF